MEIKKVNLKDTLSVLAVLMYLLSGQSALSDEQTKMEVTDPSIYDVSLENLMDLSVEVGAKSSEKVNDSAAIISIVDENEIRNFGALSLVDVLNRVTSIYHLSTYAYPDNMVSIRGNVTDQYNNRVLVLMDGRPIRESAFLGDNRAIWTTFPLLSIKQVEVLRGPGSILYGTSAFEGVINIVTKKWQKNSSEFRATYGSSFTKKLEGQLNQKWDDLEFTGGINYLASNGWRLAMTDEKGYSRSTDMSQNGLGLDGKFKFHELTLSFFQGSNTQGAIGNVPIWGPDKLPSSFSTAQKNSLRDLDYRTYSKRLFLDFGLDHPVTESWRTTLNATFNRYDFKFYYIGAQDNSRTADATDYSLEWTNFYKWNTEWNFIAGVSAWNRTAEGQEPAFNGSGTATDIYTPGVGVNTSPFQFIPKTTENVFSVYGQAEYHPLENLKLTAGGQANTAPLQDLALVPRLGAVYDLSNIWNWKVLYGEAYRSPSTSERFRVSTSATGDPKLKPETMKTLETQLKYHESNRQLALTLFQSSGKNLITRSVPATVGATSYYINLNSSMTRGVELEGSQKWMGWYFTEGLSSEWTTVNDTYNNSYQPNHLFKAGASYLFPKNVTLGVFDEYVGPCTETAYHWLTLNLRSELGEWVPIGTKTHPVYVELYAENLLDQSVNFSEYIRHMVGAIPGRPGRSIYGGFGFDL